MILQVDSENSVSEGKVFLTGAGPGDPGLLSIRALQVLQQADIVLYDGLVNPALLGFTSAICERTARTRIDGLAIVPQSEVNQRLISEARAGRCVVRLKGGDPFIFGRGSEEAEALEAAGVSFEVIPGITAATAAAEYAGFSYTHRRISSAVAFVTGHEDPTRSDSRLDYQALAAFPGTLVFYMGLGRLPIICQQLIASGKSEKTPAAVVCQASLPTQQVVQSTLKDLPAAAEEHGLKPPSLIVVGDCVELRQACSWFEKRPLFGQRIVLLRSRQQSQSVVDAIVAQSGQPYVMPLTEVVPVLPDQLSKSSCPGSYDWLLFTSENGVHCFVSGLLQSGRDLRALGHSKIGVVGDSTAAALSEYRINADVVPEVFNAEQLARTIGDGARNQRFLWARGSRGRDILKPLLIKQGAACVDEVVVYESRNVADPDPDVWAELQANRIDWVCLSSPSQAEHFADLLMRRNVTPEGWSFRVASISPLTTAKAEGCGLSVDVTASVHSWPGLLDALGQANEAGL